ncbi:disease resistance protein RGA2-like [Telopea speciosissima]|uniref:disease resistance protein RGA2-like n=1 Tax=Telopea speciosissima TaxID=54955 RepID=UPI001CC4743E|nr:disease resistance protein RGA2-like [Telopea speciosissima]
MANKLISDALKALISDELNDLMTIVQNGCRGHKELEQKSFILQKIQADIQDEEAKSLKSMERGSEGWKAKHADFLKLKDLVYDVEDLIDILISEALTSQIQQHEGHFVVSRIGTRAFHAQTQIDDEQGSNGLVARTSDKVRKSLTLFRDFFPLRKIRLNSEIGELKAKIETISQKEVEPSSGFRVYSEDPKSFPEIHVFGRKADKLDIIEMLLSDEEEIEQAFPVISVLGPVGIGKTTLAQLVACDEKVREHFDIRMWVPVGDCEGSDFDAEGVSKLILESANFTSSDGSDPSQFLQEFVTGKKFFLVLDDVWAEDVNRVLLWIKTLQTGHKGSRILVTTRSEKVANELGTPYLLQPLDKNSIYRLCGCLAFWHSGVFLKGDFDQDSKFKEHFHREMFKKTGGFPLFAKAWGGILLLEDTKGGWKSIMECEIWDASRYGMWQQNPQHNVWKDVLQTSVSSYVRLPAYLKRCFKYCSLFPKGFWVDKEVLTQLWMAEGFINHEKIGGDYFDELLSQTSFFKDIERDDNGNIVRCKMYEPLHDIVRYIAEDECSVMTDGTFKGPPLTSSTRHSSLHFLEKTKPILSSLDKANKMRTLLCFGNPSYLRVPGDFFSHLKFLRALDLSLPLIEELPHSVRTLKQLRYLNLSYTRIKKLPPFICNLYLLQTLKVSHSLLHELPKGIWKLQKLRHLENDATPMNHLPHGIGRMNKMQTLSEFIVGGENSTGELGKLTHLQGNLIISNMERINDMDDAGRANLKGKEGIVSLVLDGKKHLCPQNSDCKRRCNSLLLVHMYKEAMVSKDCSASEMERVAEVFEGINPHKNLRRLEIWNYMGSKFPKWLEDASLVNLVSLKFCKCLNVDHLPLLKGELPSLKFLHICEMDRIKIIDRCDLKGFPKLEKLFLEKMPCWETWKLETKEGESPCFMELILSNCPSLKVLPALPVTLRKLAIRNCPAICHYKPFPPLEYLALKGNVGSLHSIPEIPQLKSLTIGSLPEVNSLPRGLHQLRELRTLNIHFCPKLVSLPNELQQLTKLQEINMAGCQVLTEQWQKGIEEDWSMIARVPDIEMDNEKYPPSSPTVNKLPAFIRKPEVLRNDAVDGEE